MRFERNRAKAAESSKAWSIFLAEYELYRGSLERFRQEQIETSVPTRQVHLLSR